MEQSWLIATSAPPACKRFSFSASQVAGTTRACHHAWLIFVFLVEIRFNHIGQAGIECLTSVDLPALASQSAGIYRREPPCPAQITFLKLLILVLKIQANKEFCRPIFPSTKVYFNFHYKKIIMIIKEYRAKKNFIRR